MLANLLPYHGCTIGNNILPLTGLCVCSSGKLRPQETDRRTTEAT